MSVPPSRSGSRAPLIAQYDAVLLDLDGVVYLGDQPVPGAVEAIADIRRIGVRVSFVTNNAAHTPADVVARLGSQGIDATEDEVVTSSMAAAALLRDELPAGAAVLVVGGAGVWSAVAAAGLRPVAVAAPDDMPVAVVQGWGPDVAWANLAEATVALRAGARWVATNLDRTLPSPRGPLPGAGSLIAAVEAATGRAPDTVAGKPFPALFSAAIERSGARHPLVIGDRLDTDIAGANNAGLPSMLVLTGVSRPRDVVAAPPEQRPTYIGTDLRSLFGDPHNVEYDVAVKTLDLS